MSKGSDREFDELLTFIEQQMDFESGFYNDAYLDRRITARMRRTDIDTYRNYQSKLRAEESEREELLDSLSINVTSFFRNPDAWESFRSVLRDLTDTHRSVRIWSAPCADGREPYSIAMLALDDPEVNTRNLDILGTDINPDILVDAREGRYETSQTTDIAEELSPLDDYESYIEQDGNVFTVRDRVKDLVSFEQHDLIRGEPKRGLDMVLCRNLLIYIDSDFKVPIFDTIANSLDDDGYLMIGMTETLPAEFRDVFDAVHKQHRIYRKA
ncbi:protein-glutamate O-methyltransferase CheR [Haloarculaceae archaeon H-GB2-1]|nr:protein-glutamate O-methyltransferase CheR [Haloarculaceae archaeon H-GB1-1]MEA5385814.1 protein-glutamate O-methyltransferase CheR [Haloarculaceae archaeon H-GB11]MEA5407314.1 protein-glutamate O-methyltransferase CheR [Haloarculaceae archaeon H-GB2-1]